MIKPLGILFLVFSLISCRKDGYITSPDARLTLSADTLKFDTVFTSAGSITQLFKVRNDNDQKLRINYIELAGGNSSYYNINADGNSGPRIENLELAANDSLYVFVNLKIDPATGALPFVVRDSIRVAFNGTDRWVQLEGWGQNAHFLRDAIITGTQTWANDLPYVVLGSLQVANGAILRIEKGSRIYTHANAPWIIDGSLQVTGEKDSVDRVYFQGDRLDEPYRDFPASWPGIFFSATSRDNVFEYAVVRNAYQALVLQSPSPNTLPKLELRQCIIDNAYDAGVLAVNSSVKAFNCLISNCGKNLLLVQGGEYDFEHCTVATYSNSYILHKDPVLVLTNFVSVNNNPVTADLNARFTNCIFWGENGTVDDEVVVVNAGNSVFNVSFNANIWKQVQEPSGIQSINNLNNQPPLFDSINTSRNYYNFRLRENSPALNNGNPGSLPIDLDGNPRPVGMADRGCYERQ